MEKARNTTMNCCKSNQCIGIEQTFDTKTAESDLAEYLENGPSPQTRELLKAVRGFGIQGAVLMDVGGGVGIIQHEAAGLEAARIINVDASPSYSLVARREAERRGYHELAEYHVGDFVRIAQELDTADIVTLDRVICCYDDMPALVQAAAGRAGRVLAVVYPIDRWVIRLGVGIANAVQTLLRRPFHIFAHSNAAVEAIIEKAGFQRRYYRRGFFWQVAVYEK